MENKKEEKEKNKQILSNALKALREEGIDKLTPEQTNALNHASADDLYDAYVQIDTFDVGKCCSFENPCCAYGLCSAGALTTAALCGTALPCICKSMLTAPIHISSGSAYYAGRGVGAVLGMATLGAILPDICGCFALEYHNEIAEKKAKKINRIADQIADNTEKRNDGEQKTIFLKKLKEIISFHSYNDTERNRIKNAISLLCKRDIYSSINKNMRISNNKVSSFDITDDKKGTKKEM